MLNIANRIIAKNLRCTWVDFILVASEPLGQGKVPLDSSTPRIEHINPNVFKIARVAGHQGSDVGQAACGNHRVLHLHGPAGLAARCHEVGVIHGGGAVKSQYSACKVLCQQRQQRGVKPGFLGARCQQRNAVPQFCLGRGGDMPGAVIKRCERLQKRRGQAARASIQTQRSYPKHTELPWRLTSINLSC